MKLYFNGERPFAAEYGCLGREKGKQNEIASLFIHRNNVLVLDYRCQTQGPPHRFMWPLAALKTRDHLFLKKLTKNIRAFILKVKNYIYLCCNIRDIFSCTICLHSNKQ